MEENTTRIIGSKNIAPSKNKKKKGFRASFSKSDELKFKSNGNGTCTVIGVCNHKNTAIEIPLRHNNEHVTDIGSRAFGGCKNLTRVLIPESIKSIGDRAFCDCESLADIVIPESVTSMGDGIFKGCRKLTKNILI